MRKFILTHKAEILFFLSATLTSVGILMKLENVSATGALWMCISVTCLTIKLISTAEKENEENEV